MKALIAISISREWNEAEFLMQMGSWNLPRDWQIKIGWFRQFTAAERHNVSLNEAKYNYDRILWMDTDQVYPPEYIEMMLAHDEPVVTALNVSRYHPFEFTAYRITGENRFGDVTVPMFESMAPPNEKLFECDMTGTGALMVDPNILDKIELPYFKDVYDSEGCVRHLCDDFYFCWQLHKAGIKIVVDQSIMVKHIAKMLVSPYNRMELRTAWEKVNSGYGYWKDGRK
jgi:GT2 family glycosyltransferase